MEPSEDYMDISVEQAHSTEYMDISTEQSSSSRIEKMALKNALLEILSCMLSPNGDVRRLAEERKKALEVTEEYGMHLLEISLSSEEAIEERLMACILLKQYIMNHWVPSEQPEHYINPVASEYLKQKIRTMFPLGLNDSNTKIQNAVSAGLAAIALHDYPHNWPDMVNIIRVGLESTSLQLINGTIQFLIDFARSMSRQQICFIAPEMYTHMFKFLQNENKHSTALRAKVIHVFTSILALHTLDQKIRRGVVPEVAGRYCQLFAYQLSLPYGAVSDFRLKAEILKAFAVMVHRVPEVVESTITNTLPTVWNILTLCGEEYVQMLIHMRSEPRDEGEEDDDDSFPGFSYLVYNIFELIHCLIDYQKSIPVLIHVLPDLLYYIIIFMSVVPALEMRWREDQSDFVQDDLEDSFTMTVRVNARDLLLVVVHDFDNPTVIQALTFALEKHMAYANMYKMKGDTHWWRILESVMYALGAMSYYIVNLARENKLMQLNIRDYLIQWTSLLESSPSPFLLGRTLWIAGRLSVLLSTTDLMKYLSATVTNLQNNDHVLRISAVRAVFAHCESFKVTHHLSVYVSILSTLLNAMMYVLENSEGVALHISLDALFRLMELNRGVISSFENRLILILISIFVKNLSNPSLMTDCQNIVKELSMNLECATNLQQSFLPVILNILDTTVIDGVSLTSDSKSVALDLLTVLVTYSSKPLHHTLIQRGLMAAHKCILTIDDNIVLKSGTDCLRGFLAKSNTEISTFRDNEGRTGPDYILDILKHILDPQTPESACKPFGRLCIAALNCFGNVLTPHIDPILRAILSKMQRSSLVSIEESLLIVFAYLFYHQMDAVLHFLTLIPGPKGESALAFVLHKWLARQYCYFGKYEKHITVMAFTAILEQAVLKGDKRFENIKVNGDPILQSALRVLPSGESRINTVVEYTQVPALPRIFQVLVQVIAQEMESDFAEQENLANRNNTADEIADENSDHTSNTSITELDNDDLDSPDPIDIHDPIYNLKVTDLLLAFFKSFSTTKFFPSFVSYLTERERKALISVGIIQTNI